MNIKRIQRIQRIKHRTLYEAKDLLSTNLFSTYNHKYTIGDMITLFSFMVLFTAFAYVSLMVGIPK